MNTSELPTRLQRIRKVRRDLVQDGPPWTRLADGSDFERITVPSADCDILRDLLIADGVSDVVEIGMAYGSSALAIGEALISIGKPDPMHVVIDPHQATSWSNVGWGLLQSAGLDTSTRLILEPSSIALPRLIGEDFTADAAYVDGSHRFHEVFVDLYFLQKIVRPGGLVVLDDHWFPSVQTAAAYFERVMGWQVVPDAFATGTVSAPTGWTRSRALRIPAEPFEPAYDEFDRDTLLRNGFRGKPE